MIKKMKSPFVCYLLAIVFVATSLSARKSMWPNTQGLTQDNKITCLQFKSLNGSNREAEFEKIKQFIFKDAKTNQSFTQEYLEKMLGSPNSVDANGNWIYNLNPSQEHAKAVLMVTD
jgi:hypothetical protein